MVAEVMINNKVMREILNIFIDTVVLKLKIGILSNNKTFWLSVFASILPQPLIGIGDLGFAVGYGLTIGIDTNKYNFINGEDGF